MITETGQLNPYLETDNEEYKDLITLYNNWYAEICFLSNCDWLDSNENWKKMHEYCNEHKDILKKFWLEMYNTFGEVCHFTIMLDLVFPNIIKVEGYCPLKDIEKAWQFSLLVETGEIENIEKHEKDLLH